MSEKELRLLIKESLETIVQEGRGTNLLGFIGNIGRMQGMKALDIKSMNDGMAGLIRSEKDGNVYEVQVRPASLIKDKDFWGNILKPKTHPAKTWYKNSFKNP
jgi:hypothetical protein